MLDFHAHLHQQGLYPYHLNPVQELKPEDHRAHRAYCRWLLQMTGDQPDFLNHVLWTDKSSEDYLNSVADVVMPMLDDTPLQSRRHL